MAGMADITAWPACRHVGVTGKANMPVMVNMVDNVGVAGMACMAGMAGMAGMGRVASLSTARAGGYPGWA